MKKEYIKRLMASLFALLFLGLLSIPSSVGAAEKEQVLFQDDFRSMKAMNWIPYVPGKLRKCSLKKVWVPNVGNGESGMRVMIMGFSGKWCGVRCSSFKIPGTGTLKVSFKIYSRQEKTAKLELGTRGPHKWLVSKQFEMGPQWKKITFEEKLNENAAKKEFVGARLCFTNNTDASITDVKVTYSKE